MSTIGTSTKKRLIGELRGFGLGFPLKFLLPRFCFYLIVIFPVEVGLMWGVDEPARLWTVRDHRSNIFLDSKKSRSPLTEFEGESSGELGGVILVLDPLPLLANRDGDEDGMYLVWEV